MQVSQTNPLGDVNGDGLADLAIGTGCSITNPPGGQYVLLGRTSGWSCSVPAESVDMTLYNSNNDGMSSDLSTQFYLGDFDGDGLDDLFLLNDYAYVDGVEDTGLVMVFAGRTSWPSLLTLEDADVTFAGTELGQSMGQYSRSLVTDLNGDGIDDFVASSPLHPLGTSEGETFIFFGQPR